MNTLDLIGIEHLSTNLKFDFLILNNSNITSHNYKIVPCSNKVKWTYKKEAKSGWFHQKNSQFIGGNRHWNKPIHHLPCGICYCGVLGIVPCKCKRVGSGISQRIWKGITEHRGDLQKLWDGKGYLHEWNRKKDKEHCTCNIYLLFLQGWEVRKERDLCANES